MMVFAAIALIGAGCVPVTPSAPTSPQEAPERTAAAPDPYDGWGEIQPGGVVSLRIPPGCEGDPGAGNIYVICPTADEPRPDPVMHTSSDGVIVNIGHWEGENGPTDWEPYEKVVESLRVRPGLDHDVTINIAH